jgi:hypothetical protein
MFASGQGRPARVEEAGISKVYMRYVILACKTREDGQEQKKYAGGLE